MPVKQTLVGGLRAVELNFRSVRDISSGKTVCYFSRTHLNTPGLGTLMPETFRPAADASGKNKELFNLELLQLSESVRSITEAGKYFNWITLDMPLSILSDRTSGALADKICEQFSLTANSFCFAVAESVLREKNPDLPENVARLRRRGYHVLLYGFGEIECPLIELSRFNFDYVLLHPNITESIGKNERTDIAVNSIINFINELRCEPIADGVKNSTEAEAFYEFGCNFCAGPLSGDYVTVDDLIE